MTNQSARASRHHTNWWSHHAFFATEISSCGSITPKVDDAIANIAVVFHWPPQAYIDMSLSQLMQWHQEAIDRNGNDAE
ncbi:GpE family phage tail protein [Acinetobacter genomosp. 33YU]|uniref:GpE family phage tail protein n=1 Tax=Acinetobacter genomosp. 33YU TaxID=1675530 RepID=UPI002ADF0915|nr:GpE family phage tail protein [Acinetobacter genomosp. 33YU]